MQAQVTTGATDAPPAAHTDASGGKRRTSFWHWLERKAQPYIVAAMVLVAVIRGFYLFTDKLINLSHYPTLNLIFSVVTGVALSLSSELTFTISGRRRKLYRAQLYNAEVMAANARTRERSSWEIEVRRLREHVRANGHAVFISGAMSIIAAASYLIDSTLASSRPAQIVAALLAGYVLYIMWFHGVQTDELRDDKAEETAALLSDGIHKLRLSAMDRLISHIQGESLQPGALLHLIVSGLPVTEQRTWAPMLRSIAAPPNDGTEDTEPDRTYWLSTADIATRLGRLTAEMNIRQRDNVMRSIRRQIGDKAESLGQRVHNDPVRGWVMEPEAAAGLFGLDLLPGGAAGFGPIIIDADIMPTAGIATDRRGAPLRSDEYPSRAENSKEAGTPAQNAVY